MPAAGVACMIQEMALSAASPPGLISDAGNGCMRVQRSGAGAEGGKEGREEGREVEG